MCVCVCVCVCVSLHIPSLGPLLGNVHVCMCVFVNVCVCMCIYVYIFICVYTVCTSVCLHVCTCPVFVYVCACVSVCVYVCVSPYDPSSFSHLIGVRHVPGTGTSVSLFMHISHILFSHSSPKEGLCCIIVTASVHQNERATAQMGLLTKHTYSLVSVVYSVGSWNRNKHWANNSMLVQEENVFHILLIRNIPCNKKIKIKLIMLLV